MKQLIYAMGLLLAAGAWSCQKDVMEGEVAEGLALNVMSGVEGLSNEALAGEVEGLHVLVYDEAGGLVAREEFAGLAETRPLKLELGRYTLAYVGNAAGGMIGGAETGSALEEVTLSAEEADGRWRMGNVFTGTDEVTVGEDKSSDAVLRRVVGRLDVRVDGLTGGASVALVALTGSPRSVRFTGEAAGEAVEMVADGAMTGTGVYEGTVLAFPTSKETAMLRVAVNGTGGTETYEVALKNRLEANKVNTVKVKYNAAVVPHELTLTLEYQEDWGTALVDSTLATEQVTLDALTLKVVMEEGALTDLSRVTRPDIYFENLFDRYHDFSVYGDSRKEMRGDTLVIYNEGAVVTGVYRITNLSLDSEEGTVYRLKETPEVEIDESGVAVIVLPKGVSVVEGDLSAMKELREALLATDYYYARQWNAAGDDVSMWQGVEVNEEGRVVAVGGAMMGNYYEGAAMMEARAAGPATSRSLTTDAGYEVIELPESFKNLTELRYFTLSANGEIALKEVPTWLKDMEGLEELAVMTEAATLPELPAGLRLLYVEGYDLTTIPASVENLTELVVVSFNEQLFDAEEGVNESRIMTVEADLSKLTKLKELLLVGSDEADFPASLWQNGSVEELAVSGFNGMEVPASHGMMALKELKLENRWMSSADLGALASCPELVTLHLWGESVGKDGDSMDWIGELGTLEEIYLSRCQFAIVPASWDALTGLKYMEITGNGVLTGQLPAGLLERYERGLLDVWCYSTPNFFPDGVEFELRYDPLDNLPYTGGTYTMEVTSNRAWTVSVDESFPGLTVSPMSGSGNGTVTVTVPENAEAWSLSGNVVIKVNERHQEAVYLYQVANPNVW